MIFETFANLLRQDAALKALIGDRVYFGDAPAGQPYPDVIQYVAAGGQGTETLEVMEAPWRTRVSFECRAPKYGGPKGAHAVGDHVQRIMNNLSGRYGSENIQLCRQVSDVAVTDDTTALQRRILDFMIIWSPA
jgi:hypothetical protein